METGHFQERQILGKKLDVLDDLKKGSSIALVVTGSSWVSGRPV